MINIKLSYFFSVLIIVQILICFTCSAILNISFKENIILTICYSTIISILLLSVFANKIDILNFSFYITLVCIFFYLFSTNRNFKLFLLILKSYYTFLLSFMVMFSLSEIFSKENVYILIESKFNLFILLALSLLLFVICEMLSIKLITSEKLDYILLSTNIFIPISMFVLLISKNYSFFYILNFSRHSYLVSAVFLGSTLLEFYFAVFAIVAISKSYDVSLYKHKNQILNMQYDLQVSNFRMLEEHEADIRRISHDINNHKTILYNLIKDKNYDEALSYLEKYGSGFSNVKYEVLTNNKILNALFLSKKDICINNNITLKLDIGLPQNLGISDFDLCIIVGNLFDNAIEACNKMESCNDKYITLKSKIINNNFVFELKNSFNGIINTNNNSFITLKKDSLNHGLGISNVRDTVNKYIGTLDFKASDNEFSAFIRIPIN